MILERVGVVSMKVSFLLFILGFSSVSVASQDFQTINLEEIPQTQVRKYIVSKSIDQMDDYSSIHASWKKGNNESDFNTVIKTFYLKYPLTNVWEYYTHSNPVRMWNGECVRFGLMISKYSDSVFYRDNSSIPLIDTGQVFFLDLRLMNGLINVPVAFEMINIDKVQKIVEFSYIEDNKSLGKQTIQFFDNGEGKTRIVHCSYFKSGSSFRDKVFYPYFHKKLIKEFHGNMKLFIMSR